jgi:hypothetical protein
MALRERLSALRIGRPRTSVAPSTISDTEGAVGPSAAWDAVSAVPPPTFARVAVRRISSRTGVPAGAISHAALEPRLRQSLARSQVQKHRTPAFLGSGFVMLAALGKAVPRSLALRPSLTLLTNSPTSSVFGSGRSTPSFDRRSRASCFDAISLMRNCQRPLHGRAAYRGLSSCAPASCGCGPDRDCR